MFCNPGCFVYTVNMNNTVEAYKLEEGNEISVLGNVCIVEAVTMLGMEHVAVHTTVGAIRMRSTQWVRVLS